MGLNSLQLVDESGWSVDIDPGIRTTTRGVTFVGYSNIPTELSSYCYEDIIIQKEPDSNLKISEQRRIKLAASRCSKTMYIQI